MDITNPKTSHFVQAIDSLSLRIRAGQEPDNPRLFRDLLNTIEFYNSSHGDIDEMRELYIRFFQLLMDTLSDTCLPWHWRYQCMDYSYRVIILLQRLAVSESHKNNLAACEKELYALGNYFL